MLLISLILLHFLIGFIVSMIAWILSSRDRKHIEGTDICLISVGTICGLGTLFFIVVFLLFWTLFQLDDLGTLFKNPFYKKEIKK